MQVLLGITFAAQLVLFCFTAISLLVPQHRVWPPPSGRSWQFYSTWFLSWVSLSGVFLLAIFDGNSLELPFWLRFVVGPLLFVLSTSFIAWAFRELSVETSLGMEGSFIEGGPYRWSRNPQYVGTCVYLASLVLMSGSYFAAIGGLFVAVWFLVSPFVEEPWLAERFGSEYEAYRRAVPRFFGFRASSLPSQG